MSETTVERTDTNSSEMNDLTAERIDMKGFTPSKLEVTVRRITYGSEEYRQMVALRNRILRIPLGLRLTSDQLAAEINDLQIAAFVGDRLVGSLVLTAETPDTVQIRQVAVDDTLQGRGIGRTLMTFAEKTAREHGFKKIVLHGRETACAFYERLGYRVEGEPYIEVTLPHHTMWKRI